MYDQRDSRHGFPEEKMIFTQVPVSNKCIYEIGGQNITAGDGREERVTIVH